MKFGAKIILIIIIDTNDWDLTKRLFQPGPQLLTMDNQMNEWILITESGHRIRLGKRRVFEKNRVG